MSKPEWETIGENFLQQYFSANQYEHLLKFYGNDSILSVEKDKFNGGNEIAAKLASVPGEMKVSTYEIQPSTNGILIFISGGLTLQGEQNAFPFVRVFFLAPTQQGSLYIKNDMYKLTLG